MYLVNVVIRAAICSLLLQSTVSSTSKTNLKGKVGKLTEVKDTNYQYEYSNELVRKIGQQIASSATTKCPSNSNDFDQSVHHSGAPLGNEQISPAIIEWRLISSPTSADDEFLLEDSIMSNQVDDDCDSEDRATTVSHHHEGDKHSQHIAIGGEERDVNWPRWERVAIQSVGQQNAAKLLTERKQHLEEKFHLKTRKQQSSPVGSHSFFAQDPAGEQVKSELEQQVHADQAKPWTDEREISPSAGPGSAVKVISPSIGDQVADSQPPGEDLTTTWSASRRFQSSLANAASIARQLAKQANSSSDTQSSEQDKTIGARAGEETTTPVSVFAGGWTDRQVGGLDATFAADATRSSSWSPSDDDGAGTFSIGNGTTTMTDRQLVPKYLGLGQLHKIEPFNGNDRTQARLSCQFGEANSRNLTVTVSND